MILHTILSQDEVLGDNKSPAPEYKYYKLKSGYVQVSGKTRCVNAVFSTDPRDYLAMRPGARIPSHLR